MLRRHWLPLLVAATLGYFGLAAAPMLAALAADDPPAITLAER
jgi:hypothetical protein